jgi:uncharacterized phage protein gp47/JayE
VPINIPESAEKVEARSKSDVQRELSQSNPFLKNSWLGAIVTSTANRIFDFYLQLTFAIRQNFPDTSTDDFLVRWAAIWGRQRLAASQATGRIASTGTPGGTIPIGTVLTYSGQSYTTTSASILSPQSIDVASIERSGQTATVTTVADHNLANNVPVTITGADQSEYNVVDAQITVTGLNQFEYQVAGSPITPGTGTILASFTSSSVPIVSDEFGSGTNLDAGTQLRLQSPIVDVDDILTVDFGEIGGGSDEESDASLRNRLLDRIQNPVAHFNVSDISGKAKEVPGVTRVFVQEVTPVVGQVTIYFMRDNDDDPIPSASEVTKVKNEILKIKPANTSDSDVFVLSPSADLVDFTFSSITPDTSTMRAAIAENLQQYFAENTSVGVDIDQDAYRSAIFNTVDTVTGDVMKTFTLSAPLGDIAILPGKIGVLGTVGYL